MPLSILFWVLMILWLIFGFWVSYEAGTVYPWRRGGGHLLTWILLAILGWKVFGGPIQ
jgi:hypothetical protein